VLFDVRKMSPPSAVQPATPSAAALANRIASAIGLAVLEERRRRGWTTRDVAQRARVAASTVSSVEARRRASLDVYARLAVALGLQMQVVLDVGGSSRPQREGADLVHAAMGELWAELLAGCGYEVAIDQPYQHYQFAGRADVLAWTSDPACLLHIENRTRFPDLQQAAGSYNAKREFLAPVVARQIGIKSFKTVSHVMVGLWSAEVIHSIRTRRATFRALCPDDEAPFAAWLAGKPPVGVSTSSLVLLDPFTRKRSARIVGLARVLDGVRPRVRGYREAAGRLRREGRA
jgi:transcriptional regulator with XRE-family HTH domain